MRNAYIIKKIDNKYTWYLRSDNGKTVATGSLFTRKYDVIRAIKRVKKNFSKTEIILPHEDLRKRKKIHKQGELN
jgi:uncharacterized protein YegP (UPF0339 family)